MTFNRERNEKTAMSWRQTQFKMYERNKKTAMNTPNFEYPYILVPTSF